MTLIFKVQYKNQNFSFPIDSNDLKFEHGYCPIYFALDEVYYSGVINENYQLVVPMSCAIKKDDFSVITIFKNHKAIYGVKDEDFYLIDLRKTKFEIQEDCLVPTQYEMHFDAYDDVNDTTAILYQNGNYFLYDVSKNKKLSIDFEYLFHKNNKVYGSIVFVPEIYTDELIIDCNLNKKGQIQNPVHLGKVSIWLNKETLQKKENLIKEVSKVYQKEFTMPYQAPYIFH